MDAKHAIIARLLEIGDSMALASLGTDDSKEWYNLREQLEIQGVGEAPHVTL